MMRFISPLTFCNPFSKVCVKTKEGIEFYYYDQLGVGNSDIQTDTSLWNIPRYVEEV